MLAAQARLSAMLGRKEFEKQVASKRILQVEDLRVRYRTRGGEIKAVNGVNFELNEGSILCIVGESGSGKTTTALAMLGLLPNSAEITGGRVNFQETDLLRISFRQLRRILGKEISFVFQDPRASLNPVQTVGPQIEEVVRTHVGAPKSEALRLTVDMLGEMGLPEPRQILNRYPFQLSGGMCQRVMLAMALVLQPRVLIADEPTSHLDVTLQAEILKLLKSYCKDLGISILLITHDMGVVAQMADEVAVMYAGSIVEQSEVRSLFQKPFHPYTWGIFQALPRLDEPGRPLRPIPGNPPNLLNLPDQCPYIPRCPKVISRCRVEPMPPREAVETGHLVACYNTMAHE